MKPQLKFNIVRDSLEVLVRKSRDDNCKHESVDSLGPIQGFGPFQGRDAKCSKCRSELFISGEIELADPEKEKKKKK